MGPKALHSWGWEAWWGWDTKCSPFRVIVPGPHSMGPISPGARDPSYSWHMNGTSIGWYTVCSGKVWKIHLISTSPGIQVPPPAPFLRVSPLWEGSTLNSRFCTAWNFPGEEGEWGDGMRHNPRCLDRHMPLYFPNLEEEFPCPSGAPETGVGL